MYYAGSASIVNPNLLIVIVVYENIFVRRAFILFASRS